MSKRNSARKKTPRDAQISKLMSKLVAKGFFRDNPSNFYWNRFIFDRQEAKNKFAQFLRHGVYVSILHSSIVIMTSIRQYWQTIQKLPVVIYYKLRGSQRPWPWNNTGFCSKNNKSVWYTDRQNFIVAAITAIMCLPRAENNNRRRKLVIIGWPLGPTSRVFMSLMELSQLQ